MASPCVFPANRQKNRADERTRTADLISLRVIGWAVQGCAGGYKYRIFRRLSLLGVALRYTVLRSRWCQSGIKVGLVLSLWAKRNPAGGREPTRSGGQVAH